MPSQSGVQPPGMAIAAYRKPLRPPGGFDSAKAVERSVDSAMETTRLSIVGTPATSATTAAGAAAAAASVSTRSTDNQQQRWIVEEPVRQSTTRLSPAKDTDMATTRGPNVSVLHLRSTSNPWETIPTSVFTTSTASSRSYSTTRTSQSCQPQLTKHQSLGGYNQSYKYNTQGFHSGGEINSTEIFLNTSCNRELSPVRWCDKEVDGVYLGRSGWVQVQQRSLDENRRHTYVSTESLQPSKRIGIKLADYHCKSEPGKYSDIRSVEPQRPVYLPLRARDFEGTTKRTPSPRNVPENFSPPSITPIISPPPAFQDKATKSTKTRTFFGKAPFLPRSNAIVDSDDVSPPTSPKKILWNSAPTRRPKPISPSTEQIRSYPRIPQTKSLEDTTATRRTQFIQKYGESSSSSSSSMGFRSLDSYVPRVAMPRLSENTDSSVDVYEDADDEDNNSSSVNISMMPPKEKTSPSGRNTRLPYRVPIRKSPASSDSNKQPSCASPTSSTSSSGNEFPTRSPSGTLQQMRRSAPARQYQIQEDPSLRVRRSRSLQLPERKAPPNFGRVTNQKVSPQHPEGHRVVVKIGGDNRSNKKATKEEDMNEILREAEVVTSYLYGNRTRAAQQALMIHRYNNVRDDKSKPEQKVSGNNVYNIYVVGNGKDRQKVLQRGSTAPTLTTVKKEVKNPCNSDTCDFWPHCAHRDTLNTQAQSMMRLSHSYPTHQRSMDKPSPENNRPTLERSKRLSRADTDVRSYSNLPTRRPTSTGFSVDSGTTAREKQRLSPNKSVERKTSPVSVVSARSPVSRNASSSSSSDVYVTTSDRTSTKSPKNVKSSGGSTPMDEIALPVIVKEEAVREIVLTRPGSAPGEENKTGGSFVDNQQRSMSLPKSFLSASYQPADDDLPKPSSTASKRAERIDVENRRACPIGTCIWLCHKAHLPLPVRSHEIRPKERLPLNKTCKDDYYYLQAEYDYNYKTRRGAKIWFLVMFSIKDSKWLRLQNDAEEDNLPLTEWVRTLSVVILATQKAWDNFSNVDKELETEEDITEDEILAGSSPSPDLELEINNDEVEMDETTEFQPSNIKDAFSAVERIQHFFTFNPNLKNAKTESALLHLEKIIEKHFFS
ncbi:hypothetical protein MML48_6g00007227 [Holotrichia oblita]|uniref:Uncharacterized protein n=1 Tax=Holotrichia oblita TaxID=644536 RepID=A0ACB9SYP5_HOLOL|nr:hypothetical protein MML48_6g00007227 [Holotrichia oblita]